MDRDADSLSRAPDFNWRRLWIVLALSAGILTIAALLVRTFPNSGQQAGYDATLSKGQTWVHTKVDSAGGTALRVCDELYAETESSPTEPRYEYESFLKGCQNAVDHLYGRHVALVSPGG